MDHSKKKIAVFASNRGSNFKAIVEAIEKKELAAEIVALISDREDAPVLQYAAEKGIPHFFVSLPRVPDKAMQRREHEKKIMDILKSLKPEFLVLAGYTRLLTPFLLEPFKSERGYFKVVNIHPSLLPSFPGLKSYEKAFQYGCSLAGFSIHLVDEKCDHGPLCEQFAFSISDCQSADEVERRGLEKENEYYPKALAWILMEKFEIDYRFFEYQRRPCVRKS